MAVCFGPFQLDRNTRQLLRGGEEIHLSPKAFELLMLLVDNRPNALSKAELHTKLWPDTFVTEANLAGLVKEIRRALRDEPRQSQFVRTLHGFGYAFSEAATEVTGMAAPPPSPDQTTFWVISDGQISLKEGENLLGRDAGATVWFEGPGVSRRHARILVTGDEAVLEDLGSKNGTYLRGERISSPSPLQDGDVIRVGSITVTFRVRRVTGSTQTQEF